MIKNFLPGITLLISIAIAGPAAHAFTVANDPDSTESIVVVGEKMASPAKWEGRVHGCPGGSFHDPRKGGQCWKCDSGYKRTVFAVHGKKACQKKGQIVFGGYKKAKFVQYSRNRCKKGTFRNGVYNQCYSCPAGFRRSAKIAVDLTTVKDACIGNSYFYVTLGKNKQATAKHALPIYNVKIGKNEMLNFSAYSAKKKCGWFRRPLKKGATPGLSPKQKACHIISFKMRATETALVTSSNGRAWAHIYRTGSTKPYKLYCHPPQPPNHSTGASCHSTEAQVGQYQY
jgi:hypothetical protein